METTKRTKSKKKHNISYCNIIFTSSNTTPCLVCSFFMPWIFDCTHPHLSWLSFEVPISCWVGWIGGGTMSSFVSLLVSWLYKLGSPSLCKSYLHCRANYSQHQPFLSRVKQINYSFVADHHHVGVSINWNHALMHKGIHVNFIFSLYKIVFLQIKFKPEVLRDLDHHTPHRNTSSGHASYSPPNNWPQRRQH